MRQKKEISKGVKLKSEIFKANDIRGLYPKEINVEFAYLLGRAFVKLLNSKLVVVGRDSRSSSKILFKSLSQGIIDQGADVIDIGVATSPIFNFAVAEYDLHDSGIMITASHLPSQYNGFKMVDDRAIPLELKKRLALKEMMEKGALPPEFFFGRFRRTGGKGNLIKVNLTNDYRKKIFSLIKTPFSQLEKIARKINFKAEYDKDADRIIFFDEKGEKIRGDLIAALLAEYLLKNKRGGKIVYSVNSSKIVKEEIAKNGGKPIVSKVGHYFLKKKMKEENGLFGGEPSGHYYFKDFYFCECPDLVLLKILEITEKEKKTLRELIVPFKKYYSTGEINFEIKNRKEVVKKTEKHFKKAKKFFLDGLTCEFKDWWFNLRPSQTENVLRLVIEADSKELVEKKKKEIKKLILDDKFQGDRPAGL